MARDQGRGMILREHKVSDGEIDRVTPLVLDDRVPPPLQDRWHEPHSPRVAEHSPYVDDACHGGRHLFDIVESVVYREVYDDNDEYLRDEEDFRARLTCVRCGRVAEWEGTRQRRAVGRLLVEPIAAGDLTAQHVNGRVTEFGRDCTTWLVHRGDQAVGVLQWSRGSRGREFHVGRLEEWPPGVTVEGKTPIAALRAIAKHVAGAESRMAESTS